MIKRQAEEILSILANQFKSVAVIGPRQSGKTTLVKAIFPDKPYVNLENPDVRLFATEDPRGFLSQYQKGAILDEIQRVPIIFSYLQQILDDSKRNGLFILTGSNNFLLQENMSQSLAGRVAFIKLLPLCLKEIEPQLNNIELDDLMIKGFYPSLHNNEYDHSIWFNNYIATYIEKDVRQIKNISNLHSFEKLIHLCAGRVGNLLNINSIAIEVGVDNKTINSWLSILESSFVLFRLQPYHKNYSKRIVKMPKLYFYDIGLLCNLLRIETSQQLSIHPMRGYIFENMIIADLIKNKYNQSKRSNIYFWRDHVGKEIDIIIENHSSLIAVEIKSGKTITSDYFKNIDYWTKISNENKNYIIYGGIDTQLRNNAKVLSWREIKTINEL